MDARFLAAVAAAATTLGALGLVAVVLTSQADQGAPAGMAPILIARADPAPSSLDVPPAPSLRAPDLDRPAEAFPARTETPDPPPAPAARAPSRPIIASLPPVPTVPTAPPALAVKPAPPPAPKPPVVNHRYDGVLTVAEISRIRTALKLSPDQEPYWPPIASILREVGRRQMDQVDAGQKPSFDLPGDLSSRLYSAVGPLLGTLRDDQKEEVRRRAKMLGLDSVASFI